MKRYFFILFLLCGALMGQTLLAPVPKLQFLDSTGKPLASGCLYTYRAGTSTIQYTYTDSTGLTQNTDPVVLDSGGFASVWLGSNAYKFVLTAKPPSSGCTATPTGTVQWTVDNIPGTSFPFLNFPETVAPSCPIGTDVIWGDSTAHSLKFCNNGGSSDTIAGLTSTQTMTNKTITSPSLSNPTTTGSNTFAETSAPTCTAGNDFVWGDSTAHALKFCNNGGSTDAVAGLASAQTLTNKTIGAGTTFSSATAASSFTLGAVHLPNVTVYTSGSGTYSTPSGSIMLHVRMCGGGAGGAGSGNGGAGNAGGNTTFGSATANGGSAATGSPPITGGYGGGASNGTINAYGGSGGSTLYNTAVSWPGGVGGGSVFGTGGATSVTNGIDGRAYCSAGGGAGTYNSNIFPGAGGGAGGYVESWITSPASTYSYGVGTGGAGGGAGTNGYPGGAGAAGLIVVESY